MPSTPRVPLNHTRRATYCITPTRRAPVKHTLCVGGPHHTGRPLKAMLQAAAARAAAAAAADVFFFSLFQRFFIRDSRFPKLFFSIGTRTKLSSSSQSVFCPNCVTIALRSTSPRLASNPRARSHRRCGQLSSHPPQGCLRPAPEVFAPSWRSPAYAQKIDAPEASLPNWL